jgi:hypothetical protein
LPCCERALPDQFAGQDFCVFFFVGLVSSFSISIDPFAKGCRPTIPAKWPMVPEVNREIIRGKPSAAHGATIPAAGDHV